MNELLAKVEKLTEAVNAYLGYHQTERSQELDLQELMQANRDVEKLVEATRILEEIRNIGE